MAAPAFETLATLTGATAANGAVPVPSGVVADDVAVVGYYLEPSQTVTPPDGTWTEKSTIAAAGSRLRVFWHRAAGPESGTWTFTHASTFRKAFALRISGCVTSGDPFDQVDIQVDNAASTTSPSVQVNTTVADTLLVWVATQGITGGDSWTAPSTFTIRHNEDVAGTATVAKAATGSTGSVTGTLSSSGDRTAWLGALKPLTAGGGATSAPMRLVRQIQSVGRRRMSIVTFTQPVIAAEPAVNYAQTITDPVGLADSRTQTLAAAQTITDPVGLADAATRAVGGTQAVTDPVGLTDAASASFVLAQTITDAVGLVDSRTQAVTSLIDWAWMGAVKGSSAAAADPEYPASGVTAGDGIFCVTWNKATSGTGAPPVPAAPSGWTEVLTDWGGTGTAGVGTGPLRVTIHRRNLDADGTENGVILTDLIANPSGSSYVLSALYGLRPGGAYDLAYSVGSDTTSGTSFSVATATDPGLTASDLVIAIAGFDVAPSSSASAETITASGATLGTVTERYDASATSGNQGRGVIWTATVTAGTSSAAPTIAATAGVAVTGVGLVIRTRGQATGGDQNRTITDPVGLVDQMLADRGLPAPIPGVSPETQELSGPVIDGNGNLYAVTETDVAGGSKARMMKSVNGGRSWAEVDQANRPSGSDLEAQYLAQRGTVLHSVIQRSGGNVHYATFNTSDAASNPDTWQLNEANQFTSTVTVQGSVCIPYAGSSDVLAIWHDDGGAKYAKRSGGTWGSASTITGATRGCVAVRGASDLVHVFYNDTSNNIQHRSLTSGGTLSAAEQVNDTAGHTVYKNLSNPVYYDDDGAETVTIVWGNSSGHLRAARVVNDGTPTAEETVNSTVCQSDPGFGNEALIATLAVDAATKTVYVVWVDDATQDLWTQTSVDGGAWTSAVEREDGVTADWIHGANVYTHAAGNGGNKVLAWAFNNNLGGNEFYEGISYDELVLAGDQTRTITDPVGLADGRTQVAVATQAPSDYVGLLDLGVAADQTSTVTDAVGLVDSTVQQASGVTSQTFTDPLGLADSRTQQVSYVQTVTDPVGLADGRTQAAAAAQTVTDGVGLADSTVQEGAGVTSQTFTDPVALADSRTQAATYVQTVTDAVGLADTRTQAAGYAQTVTDGVGLVDSTVQQASGFTAYTFTDLVGTSDQATQQAAATQTLTDSQGVTDTQTRELGRPLTDPAGLTDAATQALGGTQTVTDPVGLGDSQTQQFSGVTAYTITDPVGLADTQTRELSRDLTDPEGVGDTQARQLERPTVDTVGVADTAVQAASYAPTKADPVGLADSRTQDVTGPTDRTLSDPVGITDTVTWLKVDVTPRFVEGATTAAASVVEGGLVGVGSVEGSASL